MRRRQVEHIAEQLARDERNEELEFLPRAIQEELRSTAWDIWNDLEHDVMENKAAELRARKEREKE